MLYKAYSEFVWSVLLMDNLTYRLRRLQVRMTSPFAGPSSPRKLTGSTPGILDSTQRDRLLTFSKSTLSFASFNPRTATSSQLTPDARKLSLNEDLYNPKRVVIETSPTGESFWRFVPKARIDEGVVDEGDWPRVIDICGCVIYTVLY